MKTINTRSDKIEIFSDSITGKQTGFKGSVEIFGEPVYIDTRTGIGYESTLKKLAPCISKLSSKYSFDNAGFVLDDVKQHIAVLMLEKMPKYNSGFSTKLSTFLYTCAERQLINEVRNLNNSIRNATTLNVTTYSVICGCKSQFVATVSNEVGPESIICSSCDDTIKNARVYTINRPESPILVHTDNGESTPGATNQNMISDTNKVFIKDTKAHQNDWAILRHDINQWISTEPADIQRLIEMVCVQDYSVVAAAKELNISHTGATNKLRNLKKKRRVREIFGR